MRTLYRLAASIKANFDWMVSQVENHEALVNSAINEVQQHEAHAKVQLNRLRTESEKMERELKSLSADEENWRKRAIDSANSDEKKALECVKRLQNVRKRKETLAQDLSVQQKLAEQLTADLGQVKGRLDTLKRQRNALRSRESRAAALAAASMGEHSLVGELDNIFERWEVKVVKTEAEAEVEIDSVDALEEEFLSVEEEEGLKEELKRLMTS